MNAVTTTQATSTRFEAMPIGGEWRTGNSSFATVDLDPWSGETLLSIPSADASDVDEAFRTAKRCQQSWAALPPRARADVMRTAAQIMMSRHDEILWWLIHEIGCTVARAELEFDVVRGVLFEASTMPHHVTGQILTSDIPGKENRVYRTPVGVVTVISPWNFPMHLSNRSVAPALAVGNAVVLKPASDSPVTGGLLLAEILEQAGLPPGVLNVVIGSGREIGDLIVQHPGSRHISFTGSSSVGLGITQKAGVKRLGLELGGNGPMVILDDADLDAALDAASFGAFLHQGQICMRANRIIVDTTVHDEFLERFTDRVRGLRIGDPSDPATKIGPVINRAQLGTILDKINRAVGQGARVLLGGDPTGPYGLSLPPHVLSADNHVATAQEEVFGPVITIVRADNEADALAMANDTEYGLSSAVFTADAERGVKFALQVETGMTHVNDSPLNDEGHMAFGGEKSSGIGRFGGIWAVEEFTTDHWISVQHTPRKFPL